MRGPAFYDAKYGHVIFEIPFMDSLRSNVFFSAVFKDLTMPSEV